MRAMLSKAETIAFVRDEISRFEAAGLDYAAAIRAVAEAHKVDAVKLAIIMSPTGQEA